MNGKLYLIPTTLGESEIDYVMNILYDFADNNDIWIESVDM